jgi:hypothetical protein
MIIRFARLKLVLSCATRSAVAATVPGHPVAPLHEDVQCGPGLWIAEACVFGQRVDRACRLHQARIQQSIIFYEQHMHGDYWRTARKAHGALSAESMSAGACAPRTWSTLDTRRWGPGKTPCLRNHLSETLSPSSMNEHQLK